ncbi:MAG TPA: NAD(P)-dependent oxidoreductase [Chthoniobacterales bacterium]|nr:NAD(P)-dependent oxidoreductase [Chthoniobacterales bacterium]
MPTSRQTRKNVGIIGLGIIGGRVAENLRKKGFRVFVWNRTPRPVPNFVGAPAELAEICDYIQIFVSDDHALLKTVEELTPALAPRHVIMAHSTVAPASMLRAADIIERRGARFVEAPFTGSRIGAEKGELVYYVGGDEVALREARPILEASSKEIMVIGDIGQATAVKLATNIVTAASVQAMAEALALVQSVGLRVEKFVEALRGNASNSATLAMKLPKMIEGDFEPHFSSKHMLKDMEIATRLGSTHNLELSVTTATRDRLLEQVQQGHQDEDYSAVICKYSSARESTPAPEIALRESEFPATAAAAAEASLDLPQPQPEKPEDFVPMMPEIEKEEMAEPAIGTTPQPAVVPPSAPDELASAAPPESQAATPPGEQAKEDTEGDEDFLARPFGPATDAEKPAASEGK